MQNNLIPNKNDRWLILGLCFLAAIRVFIYSAAFPFFGSTDEQAHVDLVIKYSEGHIPASMEKISPHTADYIVRYESPEIFNSPVVYPEKKFPEPSWKNPDQQSIKYFKEGAIRWSQCPNHESSQAPLYYIVAGIWNDAGALFGLTGGWLLYWIRFLNVLVAATLVWIAFVAAVKIFPENRFVVLGVPLLTAFLPQDTFYSVQNDVLSPLLFGTTFIYIIEFMRSEFSNSRKGIIAGLLVAATVLVKSANLPLVIVVIGIILYNIRTISKTRNAKATLRAIGLFMIFMLTPIIIWLLRNLSAFGDLTGSESKVQMLGWTHKSFMNWFSHPIFTFHGAWVFLSELMSTFWRGELVWWNEPLAIDSADLFYSGS